MSRVQSLENDIRIAAHEIVQECPHALPPITDLMSKLSDADQHREQLLKMVHASNRYMQNMITPQQHQLLIEFTAVQAEKANISQEDLLDEICMRYTLLDVQMLKSKDFWEALNFSWHYAEGRL